MEPYLAPTSNKLYQTLALLNEAELRRLQRFMDSPYFNQSQTLSRLYALFMESLNRDRVGFDRQKVWAGLSSGAAYDDVLFRKHCSDLLKLVESFFVQEQIQEDETKQGLELLQFVVRRKIEPLNNSALKKIKGILSKSKYHSTQQMLYRYQQERSYYAMMDFDVRLNVRANLEEISSSLDHFYWIEKLKLYISEITQRKTGNFTYRLNFLDPILAFLKQYPVEESPELALYYYSFLTLYEEDEPKHYLNLKRMLETYGAELPKEEALELFDSALHYCTGRLNRGDRFFLQEYFNLFEEGIQKGIFLYNGFLAPWRFNNVVGVALGLGKIEWAEHFIIQNKDSLPANTRENTYAFNLARVFRFQKKYKQVLELLRDLEYEDIGYSLLSKRMVIMTYYDLDEFDALDSYIRSFRVFLNRNKALTSARRRVYLNWLKYVQRLMRIVPSDRTQVERLKEEVLRHKESIANHEWLIEKLVEMG